MEGGETRAYITDKMLNKAGVSWGCVSGFERHRSGAITTFDAPSAGTGPGQGTASNANNSIGVMTGFYSDANFNLRFPTHYGLARAFRVEVAGPAADPTPSRRALFCDRFRWVSVDLARFLGIRGRCISSSDTF